MNTTDLPGVVLEYFTTALGDALTPEAGQGWANFMDLCIEVVTETAKGKIRNKQKSENMETK